MVVLEEVQYLMQGGKYVRCRDIPNFMECKRMNHFCVSRAIWIKYHKPCRVLSHD